ncbi:MAG: hypothetical protein H7Z41_07105 [Cytophagales bacterium]|nr:hypothetical protein [Armatimonadota bacterium]
MHDFTNDFCFNCGGATFTWGIVTGYSAALAVFKPDPENVAPAGFWSDTPAPAPEPLRARRCETCGNIQLFTEIRQDP